MAIEITPTPRVRVPIWAVVVGAVACFAILALVGTYIYFTFSIKDLDNKIQKVENELNKIPTAEEKAKEEILLLYEAKISAYKDLLSKHKKTENVFKLLEGLSHPGVWFSEFSFNTEKRAVTVSGTAKDFVALEQQLLIFKKEPLIENVTLSEISMGKEGGADFSLNLTIDSQVFEQ